MEAAGIGPAQDYDRLVATMLSQRATRSIEAGATAHIKPPAEPMIMIVPSSGKNQNTMRLAIAMLPKSNSDTSVPEARSAGVHL
jgi:hypothetical protein